ncbi:hypothetical protein Bca101_070220 [Brassica carinata]
MKDAAIDSGCLWPRNKSSLHAPQRFNRLYGWAALPRETVDIKDLKVDFKQLCFLRQKSPFQLEQRFMVVELPRKPQLLEQRRCGLQASEIDAFPPYILRESSRR